MISDISKTFLKYYIIKMITAELIENDPKRYVEEMNNDIDFYLNDFLRRRNKLKETENRKLFLKEYEKLCREYKLLVGTNMCEIATLYDVETEYDLEEHIRELQNVNEEK